MEELITKFLDTLKTILPWLTGGLAGVTLTYILNRRLAKNIRPRLSVTISSVNYTLPKLQEAFKKLKVSYGNISYDRLSYHEIKIRNVSQRLVDSAPFIIVLPTSAEIVSDEISSEPLKLHISHDQNGLEQHQHRYILNEFHPGDSSKIRLLVDKGESITWHFRGSDEIEIEASGNTSTNVDNDLKLAILWISLYVTAGAIPLMSSIFKGFLIIASAPYIYRLYSRWQDEAKQRKQAIAHGPIVVSDSGKLSLAYNPETGESSLVAEFNPEKKTSIRKKK